MNHVIYQIKNKKYSNIDELIGATIIAKNSGFAYCYFEKTTIELVLFNNIVLNNGLIIPFERLTSWLNGGAVKVVK